MTTRNENLSYNNEFPFAVSNARTGIISNHLADILGGFLLYRNTIQRTFFPISKVSSIPNYDKLLYFKNFFLSFHIFEQYNMLRMWVK